MYEFIQQNQGMLTGVFFALAVLFLGAAAYFAILVLRTEKKADQRLKQARADITDMTILFQTMRDIIGQQKALAKDFNEELEHKMEQVKHILNQGMEKNKQLYDKQQRITQELEEAQVQIDGLYRQLAEAPKGPAPNGSNAPRPAPARASVVTATREQRDTVEVRPAPRPSPTPPAAPAPPAAPPRATLSMDPRDVPAVSRDQLVRQSRAAAASMNERTSALSPAEEARLAETGVTKAPFTSWIADDLVAREKPTARPEAAQAKTPDPADQGPSNGDAAREAFRALLNMPPPEREPAPLDIVPGAMAAPEARAASTNRPPSAPLQQRVLEYSEAGMTVAQVSRELGIGKGEVRLMLSLAKQQIPPVE